MNKNIHWQEHKIKREDRIRITGHNNKVIWMTGLSGSGKSTIANILEQKLNKKGILTYLLDGDNIRHGLNKDLGFNKEDREENIRRIAEVTKILYDAGITVITSFISPYEKDREKARKLIGKDFIEVHIDTPLEECKKRDPKGLYEKAIKGEIKEFTGITAPYEKPKNPELRIRTTEKTPEECADEILKRITQSS